MRMALRLIILFFTCILLISSAHAQTTNFFDLGDTVSIGKYSNNLATALTTLGSSHKRIMVNGTVTLATDANCPDNIVLDVSENGLIILGNYDLFVHGDFRCESGNRSFNVSGTGRVYFRGNIDRVYPEWFGAVGDGVTDDRPEIDYAFTSYNHIAFHIGKTYFISQTTQYDKEYLIDLASSTPIIIEGNGATLKYDHTQDRANDLSDASWMGSTLFRIQSSSLVVMKDLILNGDADWTVHASGATPEYAQGCGTGIVLKNCRNVQIFNIQFRDFIGDCVYLREDPNEVATLINVAIEGCEFNTWGRNAITCYGVQGLTVRNNLFKSEHAGLDFYSEKYAGIYIERDRSTADVTKVNILGNRFNNRQWGVYTKDTWGATTNYPIKLKVAENYFYDQNYAIWSQYTNDLSFCNNTVHAITSDNLVYLYEVINGIASGNIMRGTGSNFAEIKIYGRSTGTDKQAPCLMSNNIFYQGKMSGGQHLVVQGNTLYNVDVAVKPFNFSASFLKFSDNYINIVNSADTIEDTNWLSIHLSQINNNYINLDNNGVKKGDFYHPSISSSPTTFTGNSISGFEYGIVASDSDTRTWAIAGNYFDTTNNQYITSKIGAAGNSGSYLKSIQVGANGETIQRITKSTSKTVAVSATWSNAIAANYRVIGVTVRVTTAITGATSFQIGDGTDVDRWGTGIAVVIDTTTDYSDFTDDDPIVFGTAKDVVLTPVGGAFTAGVVRIVVHYELLGAPTS